MICLFAKSNIARTHAILEEHIATGLSIMQSRPSASEEAVPDKKLLRETALIKRLQEFELRDDQSGILSNNSISPARVIDKLQCDSKIRDDVESQFDRLRAGKISDTDGIALKSMDDHIAVCVKEGLITNAAEGRAYMVEMLRVLLKPLDKINKTDKATLPQSERNKKVTDYSENLDNNLARMFKIKESLMSLPSSITVFHPMTQQAIVAAGLISPDQTSLIKNVQLFKNNMSANFLQEALTNGISDELTDKYNRLSMLIDESINIINSYQAKQPVNLEKLKAIAELANALEIICNLPPSAMTSETITPITNQLRTNLSVTYENILEGEQDKGYLAGLRARGSSTLGNIDTALKEDKKYISSATKKASISAKEKPTIEPEKLVKSSNIMPTLEKPLSKEELSTDMFVGHTCQFAHVYSKNIDEQLDDRVNKYSAAVHALFSDALDAGYSSATVKGTADGKILAIIKNSIVEAITNGDIASREDGNLYAATYRDIVQKHLQNVTETDKYAKNSDLVTAEIIDPMEREIRQAEKSLKINASLKSASSTTSLFQQNTQKELIKLRISHPAQTFLTEIQLFKHNIAAKFLSEALTQGFSDDLANKYIRLNTLVDESLKIINSYQAKQPVNLEKLKAITELANALQAISNLPPNAINSESVALITNQLRTTLSVTYDRILQGEQNKSRLSGFVAKASSSTLGNITTVLQKDEKLMSAETKKAFFSAKEKPVVKSEEPAKNTSFFRRG